MKREKKKHFIQSGFYQLTFHNSINTNQRGKRRTTSSMNDVHFSCLFYQLFLVHIS